VSSRFNFQTTASKDQVLDTSPPVNSSSFTAYQRTGHVDHNRTLPASKIDAVRESQGSEYSQQRRNNGGSTWKMFEPEVIRRGPEISRNFQEDNSVTREDWRTVEEVVETPPEIVSMIRNKTRTSS